MKGDEKLGKLNDPNLDPKEKARLEGVKLAQDAQIASWDAAHPHPPRSGPEPKPQDFKLDPKEVLSKRKYFYQEALGKTGAKTGGVSSKNPIHTDGHTWFPKGWGAEPIMRVLETNVPGITTTPLTNKGVVTGTKRTGWLKLNSDGTFEVAPPTMVNPKDAGYLKSSMITPADGAQRSVFPEMNQ